MAKNFNELRDKMSPERRERNAADATRMGKELAELEARDPAVRKAADNYERVKQEIIAKGHAESVRIHMDWWGKCRTCKHWSGDRGTMKPGSCLNPASDMHEKETWTEGHCKEWDSFDVDAAIEVMAEDDARFGKTK